MNKNLLIPIAKELQSQATLIAKSVGLSQLKPQFFNYDVRKAAIEDAAYEGGPGSNNYDHIGMLGLPVYDTVKLVSPNYTDDSGNPVTTKEFVLDIALIEATNERHIITTEIAGRNGSIKEYMSNGDLRISIRGSLVSEFSTFSPYSLIQELEVIANCPETLQVESNFLSYLKVFNLVITKVRYSQQEAMRNVVLYELDCISDIPFELRNA